MKVFLENSTCIFYKYRNLKLQSMLPEKIFNHQRLNSIVTCVTGGESRNSREIILLNVTGR